MTEEMESGKAARGCQGGVGNMAGVWGRECRKGRFLQGRHPSAMTHSLVGSPWSDEGSNRPLLFGSYPVREMWREGFQKAP